ncbi:rhodanese-like domain-containing protein [Geovibrio thiophilus]|uniref:Rhodanese-like domain-containing protein n=2 Tax=Geovibrio thiophilus TaxID=139438 RepID=A0A3R6AYP3_9BACT|nr:rhodanese-like domain-containing protein [Geovibrio thiophilus]
MRMVSRILMAAVFSMALFAAGCGTAKKEVAAPAEAAKAKSVAEQIIEAGFEMVKFDEVKKVVGDGMFNASRGVLVDARPERTFDQGHIPGSVNVPDNKFEQFFPVLAEKKVTKDTYIITYCGGVDCIKSLYDAKMLKDKGYTNIKIYLDGMPDWTKQGQAIEIGFETAKKLQADGKTLFVDARPERVFAKSTIPGSVNVPDNKFEEFKNLLPAEKSETFVVYCGGYECVKSHIVAEEAMKLGYKKPLIYAGGLPEWEKMGGTMSAAAPKAAAAAAPAGAIKQGAEPGSVDKDYFKTLVPSRPANIIIVDVRTPAEFQNGHIEGAINIDVNKIYKEGCEAVTALLPKEGDVIFHCASGGRAGEMYFGLVEDCNFAQKERLHFLDAHVKFSNAQCIVE